MARFTLPRDLYHGKGALDALKDLKGKRAIVVVGGGSMKRFGFLDKVEANLKAAGMEVALFEGVEPDPSVETVMKGAKAMQEFQPDWIVAIGGGSPIDAAKAMWAFYEYPDTTFEQLCIPFNFPTLRTKAKFCAIPSTSGTATEVTAFSVITDYHKGVKYPLADFNITPDVAIVDPDLAETMPKKLTAHTGMDAMTHAIEAYVSTLHCDYTDPLALHAIKMISEDLVASYNGDMDARDQRADAQLLFISLHIHHGAKVLLRPQRFAKVRVHDAVPLVNRHRNTFFGQQRADFAHHCKINVLLVKAHMAGVDLLHVGEYGHVVDIRLVHIAQQRRDLLGIVEAGVAAEAENVLKWIFFHRAAALLSVKCGRGLWPGLCFS